MAPQIFAHAALGLLLTMRNHALEDTDAEPTEDRQARLASDLKAGLDLLRRVLAALPGS